jgi:hypothetical protein
MFLLSLFAIELLKLTSKLTPISGYKNTAAPAGLSLTELKSPPKEPKAPPIEVYLADPKIPYELRLYAS